MSNNVDTLRQHAMFSVSYAVQLDSEGKLKDAYEKYLQCIQFLSNTLSLDAKHDDMLVTNNTRQFVSLCKHCIDRVDKLLSQLPSASAASVSGPETGSTSDIISLSPAPVSPSCLPAAGSPPPALSHLPPSPTTPTATGPTRPSPSASSHRQPAGTGPSILEQAEMQNRKLLASYASRIENAHLTNRSLAASLSLAVQRRMAENLAIAKQRQLALERKQQERLKKLLAETQRQLSLKSDRMSPEEMELCRIHAKILAHEQHSKWLLELRMNMSTRHSDQDFVQTSITTILSSVDHPLAHLLHEFQSKAQTLLQAAYEKHRHSRLPTDSSRRISIDSSETEFPSDVNMTSVPGERMSSIMASLETVNLIETRSCSRNIAKSEDLFTGKIDRTSSETELLESSNSDTIDTMSSVELHGTVTKILGLVNRLERCAVDTYEEVRVKPPGDDVRRVVRSTVEEFFFPPLWSRIIDLYRLTMPGKCELLSSIMASYSTASPGDLGVHAKLTLHDPRSAPSAQPYSQAIKTLRTVTDSVSPSHKLNSILHCLQLICDCVEDFCILRQLPSPGIGADELLAILSYVIVKTQQPDLLLESFALMDFCNERDLTGESGYCLASMQTALCDVMTLPLTTTATSTDSDNTLP